MKQLLRRLFFGKPLYMAVYKDKYGNLFGGTIPKKNEVVVNITSHIEQPTFVGNVEIL